MNILLNRLLTILNNEDLKSTNYHIATKFLENIRELQHISINEASNICNVSKSTVSKFVREIGFEDYMDFKLTAIAIEEESKYDLDNSITSTEYIESAGIKSYTDTLKEDIELLKNTIDMKKIDELAMELIKYNKVATFGSIYSETAAIDLQYKLAYMKKVVYTSINDIEQDEYIKQAGDDTLIIIFTNSGRYITEYPLIEGRPEKTIFDDTKAKIVAITANKNLRNDNRVDLVIDFQYSSMVQNHVIMYQIISDIIALRYKSFLVKK